MHRRITFGELVAMLGGLAGTFAALHDLPLSVQLLGMMVIIVLIMVTIISNLLP